MSSSLLIYHLVYPVEKLDAVVFAWNKKQVGPDEDLHLDRLLLGKVMLLL